MRLENVGMNRRKMGSMLSCSGVVFLRYRMSNNINSRSTVSEPFLHKQITRKSDHARTQNISNLGSLLLEQCINDCNKRVQNNCEPVSRLKDSDSDTCCSFWYRTLFR